MVRCRTCDVCYQRPTLIPESNPYEPASGKYFGDRGGEPTIEEGRRYAEEAAAYLGDRTGQLLEVGCGEGWLIEGIRRCGWEVRGIDFTEAFAAAGRARGLDIETAGPEDSVYLAEQERYDAVLFLNILEHLYDPIRALRRAHSALRPGGVVAIGVPNEAGLTSAMLNRVLRLRRGRPSINMSPTFRPFHVVGFTPKSIRWALDATGFELEQIITTRGYSNLGGNGPAARAANLGLNTVMVTAGWVGRGDALDVWARRPG